jgi:hypothetical protein
MLTGCMLDDSESVKTALSRISRINDDVQGFLFDPAAGAHLPRFDDHPAFPFQRVLRRRRSAHK